MPRLQYGSGPRAFSGRARRGSSRSPRRARAVGRFRGWSSRRRADGALRLPAGPAKSRICATRARVSNSRTRISASNGSARARAISSSASATRPSSTRQSASRATTAPPRTGALVRAPRSFEFAAFDSQVTRQRTQFRGREHLGRDAVDQIAKRLRPPDPQLRPARVGECVGRSLGFGGVQEVAHNGKRIVIGSRRPTIEVDSRGGRPPRDLAMEEFHQDALRVVLNDARRHDN